MQPNNPLHGITLKTIVETLLQRHGWESLGHSVPIRCFTHDPSVASSLKFLRRTPWAREQVEALFLQKPRSWELQRTYNEWPTFTKAVTLLVQRLPHEKRRTPQTATLTVEGGMEGDRWASGPQLPEAQLSLMEERVAKALWGPPAWAGDNLIVDIDLSESHIKAGCRFRIGTALLELTSKPHRGCKKFIARYGRDAHKWVNQAPEQHRRDVYARVVEGGTIGIGDTVNVL